MTKDGRSQIEHIVVVMLENRSFDHLFAYLDGPPEFADRFENPAGPLAPGVTVPLSPTAEYSMSLDPPHSHPAALESFAVDAAGRYRMTGFVSAAARKAAGQEDPVVQHWVRQGAAGGAAATGIAITIRRVAKKAPVWLARAWATVVAAITVVQWVRRSADQRHLARRLSDAEKADAVRRASGVMSCMTPDKIPVLSTLAREFTLCTRWFCSVPGETWPNRTFVHCGTSENTVEIEPGFYLADTIFDRLEEGRSTRDERDRAWRIYVDGGIPHLAVFRRLWSTEERHDRWSNLGQFANDVRTGTLPAYSFIEPRHQAPGSNSQHPGNNMQPQPQHRSDFEQGEYLIAEVYEALRRSPEVFNRTLLVVTYDENGGLFDSEPPPRAVQPGPLGPRSWTRRLVAWFVERHHYPFSFRRLGARVPTIVVSPLVSAGRNDDVFDHTAIPATVRACFAPGARPLSRREARASPLTERLEILDEPRTDLPDLSEFARRRTEMLDEGEEMVAVTAAQDVEPDPFSRQLDVLARKLDAELPPGNVTRMREQAPDPRVAADRHGGVIVRLLGRP